MRHAPAHHAGGQPLRSGAAVMKANDKARLSAAARQPSGGLREAGVGGRAISRRTLLKTTGALIVGFSLAEPVTLLAPRVARAQQTVGPQNFDAWLAIAPDGKVT